MKTMNVTSRFCIGHASRRGCFGRVFVSSICSQIRHASSGSALFQAPASFTITSEEVTRARKYCLDILRRYDTPSSLLLPYIPSHARDAYIALRAFNIDIARTADTTSTPTIGAMRLQFQRDAVTKALAGTPPKQPIAILLACAVAQLSARSEGRSKFSKIWLHRLIDTREKHLSNAPFPTLASLETYAENTYSTLLYLTLQALPLASVTADHLASHIGKAAGIVALLRGLPLIAFPGPGPTHNNPAGVSGGLPDHGATRHGAVMLPVDIMVQAGVREEDVLANGAAATGLRDAVFAVATRANDHLITARQMWTNLQAGQDVGHDFEHADDAEHTTELTSKSGRAETPLQEVERAFGVLMPAVATQIWLDRLQKCDFDVFDEKLRRTDWRLPFRAWWAHSRRRL